MKNILFFLALLCSSSLVAQFSYHVYENGVTGTGIQSPTNTASGNYSTAMGYTTTASGTASTAMGNNTQASGNHSTAMGVFSQASGGYSTAMGLRTEASGDFSTALGYDTKAEDYASTAIGHYNYDLTPNPFEFSLQNTAFVIGNGTFENRSNALEILFDGTTTIAGNVTAPAFIGDGSQLTNMPLSFNENGSGIQSISNTASGGTSIAMGHYTTASGDYSTAV